MFCYYMDTLHFLRQIIRARRIISFKCRVTIMSTSSEKSLCTSQNINAEKNSSETRANKKKEAQKDERRNLSYYLAKKIYPSDFRYWPILSLLKPEFIAQIRMVIVYGNCGNRALIVTKDKDVYALDYNKDDNFKTGDTHIGLYPKKVEELCGKNIKTFACRSGLVLALTEEGEVYSWWFNKERESNFASHTAVLPPSPTRVVDLQEKCIVDIACGSDHSLALTSDGKVYAWGDNKYEQIGRDARTHFDNRPRQMKRELEGKKVVHIACGSMFNMVITDKGKLYGWGDNGSGQISIDTVPFIIHTTSGKTSFGSAVATFANVESRMHYMYPREITAVLGKAIVKVACGLQHALALTNEGKLYAWGKNDKGQVGVNNNLQFSAPVMVDVPEMGKVLDIAAFDNLSVAVGSNRTVYVWGDCFGQNITAPIPTEFSRIHDAFAYSTMRVMHKPLTVSPNDVEEVLNILESLRFGVLGTAFNDPSTSDFIVQVEGQRIHVHKAILKIRCQHFRNKFRHDWIENDESLSDLSAVYIVMDKFSYIVYKAFLKYLYTGTVDLPSDKVLELMKLADKYCETSLKRECGWIIEQTITALNVAFFYGKAIECNAKELEEFCFQFALRHMKDVVLSEDYIKLDMNTKDNFMRRAAEENAFRT